MSDGAATSDRSTYINASIWTLQSLAGLFLGLRVYCKLFRHRGLWWDDYFLITSWILLLVSAVSTSCNDAIGFGHHFVDVNPANLEKYGIFSLISGFFSILSSVCSKTSFAITLLRLTDGWLKKAIWCIIVSMNILMPMSALFLFVSCNPPQKTWKPEIPGSCWPENVTVIYGIVVGAYSSTCDLTLALLPWRILMRFRMYRREKIGVAIAMSMGVFACATGIVKCVMLPLLGSPDFTYDGAPFVVWGFAECAVTIMAASIPALRALANEVRGVPQFIQRAVPYLSKTPDENNSNGTTASTRSTGPGDGRGQPAAWPSNNEASAQENGLPDEAPSGGAEATERKRDDRSDKSILARSGLSTAEVVVAETSEAGEMLGEHDIEMGTQRHSYNLQNV